MVELTESQFEKLDRAMDSLIEIKTVLLGAEGEEDGGICGKVRYLVEDHNKLKRNFYILIAALIGSGVLGTGIWELLH